MGVGMCASARVHVSCNILSPVVFVYWQGYHALPWHEDGRDQQNHQRPVDEDVQRKW